MDFMEAEDFDERNGQRLYRPGNCFNRGNKLESLLADEAQRRRMTEAERNRLRNIAEEMRHTKEKSMIKFSQVETGSKAKMVKVREVTKISTAIRVVGLQYARSLKAVSAMRVGHTLTLQVEPTNQADKNAIQVFDGDTRIGYIERGEAAQVRDVLITLGETAVTATVSRIDTTSDIYNMLWVVIEATFYVKA